MSNLPYLMIGDQKVTLSEIIAKIIHPDKNMTTETLTNLVETTPIKLCQDCNVGTIIATTEQSSDEYPCVELMLQTPLNPDPAILVARLEQPIGSENNPIPSPSAYLYARGDTYIATMPVDIRPEDTLQDVSLKPQLRVSGDPGVDVDIVLENHYCEVRRA